jgi:hypothetical protein
MILASHGIVASQIASFDADAVAFFNRVANDGGSLSLTEKQAVNQLVLDLKANSLWTPMKAIYPMVGASAAACRQNLKSSSFTGTFTATGWTFASTGVTGNGTSAYMDTAFNNQSNWTSTTNASMGFVSRTNTEGVIVDMGSGGTPGGTNGALIYARYPPDTIYTNMNGQNVTASTNTSSIGFFVVSRATSSVTNRYKRGSSTINATNTGDSLGTNPNKTIYLGAGNDTTLGAQSFSNRQYNFCFIGDALTQTEVDNYWTALQTFNTALSR